MQLPIDMVGKQWYYTTNLVGRQYKRKENAIMKKTYAVINIMKEMCMCACYMCMNLHAMSSDRLSISKEM